MINDFLGNECVAKTDAAIRDTLQVFGESEPYIIEKRLDGKVVIFTEHFIECAREAMTTGCMAKMNKMEVNLFMNFVEYENGFGYRDITRGLDIVMEALDQWFIIDVECGSHPVMNACFDQEEIKHVTGCEVVI